MPQTVEAIFSNGVLRPLQALELTESQRVRITVEPVGGPSDADAYRAAMRALFERMDRAAFRYGGRLPTRDELHERR